MPSKSRVADFSNPYDLNAYLEDEYEYSLFCFARAYANVFIKNTFLRKSFLGKDRQKFRRFNQRLVNLKKRVRKTLREYYYYDHLLNPQEKAVFIRLQENWIDYVYDLNNLFKKLDKEIYENEYFLTEPFYRTKRGLDIYEETKIALIFSFIIRQQNKIDSKSKRNHHNKDNLIQYTKFNIEDMNEIFADFISIRSQEISQKELKPNWNDTFDLMDWFHKQTSYSYSLKKDDRAQIKERTRKYDSDVKEGLLLYDLQYFISQQYFEDKSIKNYIIIRWKDSIVRQIYPVFSIEFNKDFIEIGEIKDKKLNYEKYMKSNSEFNLGPTRTSPIEKNEIPLELIFPNDQRITLGNFKLS